MRFSLKLTILLLLAVFLTKRAFAQVTFGAEFTFTNEQIFLEITDSFLARTDITNAYRERLGDEILKSCDGCRLKKVKNPYGNPNTRVIYPDGFYFTIATDPAVVEVQVKPLTNAELQKQKDRLQRDLFDTAKRIGITPHARTGGGHIHIGLQSAFGKDLLLFRNFVVDFMNHPEISKGILGEWGYNALALDSLPKAHQEAFRRIIDEVDIERITTIEEMAQRINDEVYNWHPGNWDPTQKYQALNLVRVVAEGFSDRERTIEIRAIRPEQSVEEFAILTKLFEGRIKMLKKMEQPIPLKPAPNLIEKWVNAKARAYSNFSKYVGESGISFGAFRQLFRLKDPAQAMKTQIYPYSCEGVYGY